MDKKQGNMQGMDPYTYVGGNPETNTDPTGNYVPCSDSGLRMCGGGPGGEMTTIAAPPAAGCGPCHNPTPYVWPSTSAGGTTSWTPPTLAPRSAPVMHHAQRKANRNLLQNVLGSIGSVAQNIQKTFDSWRQQQASSCVEAMSFAPQTTVATAKGSRPIVSLQTGEKVWAYNTKTHTMELQPIAHVWINYDNDLVDLTITSTITSHTGKATQKKSEVIHTNRKHPFLTVEKGFIPITDLHIGMHVVKANGKPGVVSGWKAISGTQAMYNLTVAQDHTFTIGAGQWVVHNDNCPDWNAVASGQFDPTGLQGASIQDITSRLPTNAQEIPFSPSGNIREGYKWEWSNGGYNWMVEAHGPDANPAAAGGNASQGWILRVARTAAGVREYGDGKGNWYRSSSFDPNSPDYVPGAINDTHIPIRTVGNWQNFPDDAPPEIEGGGFFE